MEKRKKLWIAVAPFAACFLLVLVFFVYVISFTHMGPSRSSERDAKRIADVSQIRNALELYFKQCGVYPGGNPKPGSDPSCAGVSRPSQLATSTLGIADIPQDPRTGADYSYCYTPNGVSYALQANLEDVHHLELEQSLASAPTSCKNTAGAVTCNRAKGEYCVSH